MEDNLTSLTALKQRSEEYEVKDDIALGEGNFGSIIKVIRKSDKQEFAAKKIKVAHKDWDSVETLEFKRELDILSSCKHPGIIEYVDTFKHGEYVYIVTKIANQGNLELNLKKWGNLLED
jgi:calcium/calmodulin-dependent protein kinase I